MVTMEPILIEFPKRIEGERIYLRSRLPGDGPEVHDALMASMKELQVFMPWANPDQTVEESEIFARKMYAKFVEREDLVLSIYRKEDDVFLGSTGYHRIDWAVKKFEIGYWGDSRYSRRGYITEAATLLTKFAFETLQANRVEIRCDAENIASRKIPERIGYQLEGILRKDSLKPDGQTLCDTCVYAKVRT